MTLVVGRHDILSIITLSKCFAVNLKKCYHQDEGLSTVVLIVGVASDMVLHSLPGKKKLTCKSQNTIKGAFLQPHHVLSHPD